MNRLNESVPPPASPEQPPLAPYDPPAPAPQAAAWHRAIRVVTREDLRRTVIGTTRVGRSWNGRRPH
jgi:hypothetical protein